MTDFRQPEILVDTSVAVALCVADHEGRAAALSIVDGMRIGRAGHAAFEAFSVLTRLPGLARRTPTAVGRLLAANFPYSRFLDEKAAAEGLGRLAGTGIAGGAVYDALVASAAAKHQVPLATRDTCALRTYRAFDVEVVIIR